MDFVAVSVDLCDGLLRGGAGRHDDVAGADLVRGDDPAFAGAQFHQLLSSMRSRMSRARVAARLNTHRPPSDTVLQVTHRCLLGSGRCSCSHWVSRLVPRMRTNSVSSSSTW